jgi:hypothetical protein
MHSTLNYVSPVEFENDRKDALTKTAAKIRGGRSRRWKCPHRLDCYLEED